MPDNRSVGRPEVNGSFVQARDIPVAHDKPRLNDQRKVRPHGAGEPQMGVRPSGGHQPAPKKPSLNTSFMQLRDVPMEKMTEAEIAEFRNPLSRFYQSRRGFINGDAIGYQVTKDGIMVQHVRDGYRVGPAAKFDSRESIEKKMDDLKRQYQDLKDQRRELSFKPERAAQRIATQYARQNGISPNKIGKLNDEVPTRDYGPAAGPPASAAPGPSPAAAPAAPSPAAPTAGGSHGGYKTNVTGSSSMSGAVPGGAALRPSMSSSGSFSQPLGGTPASGPSAEPANPTGGYVDRGSGPPGPADTISLINKLSPGTFMKGQLERLPPDQLQSVMNNIMKGKDPANVFRTRAGKVTPKPPRAMAAEGYPDTSFERDEPSHESRIGGNLNRTRSLSDPSPPDLNREFAQFQDLHVEKVTEEAEQEMTEFLNRMTKRMGFAPLAEDDEKDKETGLNDPIVRFGKDTDHTGLKNPKMRVGKHGDSKERPDTQVEAISRTRHRWV